MLPLNVHHLRETAKQSPDYYLFNTLRGETALSVHERAKMVEMGLLRNDNMTSVEIDQPIALLWLSSFVHRLYPAFDTVANSDYVAFQRTPAAAKRIATWKRQV